MFTVTSLRKSFLKVFKYNGYMPDLEVVFYESNTYPTPRTKFRECNSVG